MCNYSGIENEHEILSCVQLEAQQELSKTADSSALGAIAKSASEIATDIKVIKRDNIVLGISDLKPKKVDTKSTVEVVKVIAKTVVVDTINKEKEIGGIAGEQITITPINTIIKVNNCEIVNRRPRSVTAAIFSLPSFLPKTELLLLPKTSTASTKPTANKTRAQSATAKIFRPNPQNVTSSIFAPRTKDMNKGFLMFSEDESGLTSKCSSDNTKVDFCQKDRIMNLKLASS